MANYLLKYTNVASYFYLFSSSIFSLFYSILILFPFVRSLSYGGSMVLRFCRLSPLANLGITQDRGTYPLSDICCTMTCLGRWRQLNPAQPLPPSSQNYPWKILDIFRCYLVSNQEVFVLLLQVEFVCFVVCWLGFWQRIPYFFSLCLCRVCVHFQLRVLKFSVYLNKL